jgi:hypothetical protein
MLLIEIIHESIGVVGEGCEAHSDYTICLQTLEIIYLIYYEDEL